MRSIRDIEAWYEDIGIRAWNAIFWMVEGGVITYADSRQLREALLGLLMKRKEIRKIWKIFFYLNKKGLITYNDYAALLDKLKLNDPNHEIRLSAWKTILDLISYRLITVEKLRPEKRYFLDLLSSSEDWIVLNAWRITVEFIDKGLITSNEITQEKIRLLDLLKSIDRQLRIGAWISLSNLVKSRMIKPDEFITNKDIRELKEELLDLLKSYDPAIRDTAQKFINEHKKIIERDPLNKSNTTKRNSSFNC